MGLSFHPPWHLRCDALSYPAVQWHLNDPGVLTHFEVCKSHECVPREHSSKSKGKYLVSNDHRVYIRETNSLFYLWEGLVVGGGGGGGVGEDTSAP